MIVHKLKPAVSQPVAGLSQPVATLKRPQTTVPVGSAKSVAVVAGISERFPVEALPEIAENIVRGISEAMDVDPGMAGVPLLAIAAGGIGNRRRVRLTDSYWEPAILRAAVVAPSGSTKTPVISALTQGLFDHEAEEVEQAQVRQAEYDEELQEWKSTKKEDRGEAPEKPEPAQRLILCDATSEATLAVHAYSPMGLLMIRDELAGWLNSQNQYHSGGKGSDAQVWNELYEGKTIIVDRKVGNQTLAIRRGAASMVGGIPPAPLRECLRGAHLEDGTASRFLFAAPPTKEKVWTEKTIPEEATAAWNSRLDEIRNLSPDKDGDPVDLSLTREAKTRWITFYDDFGKRLYAEEDGPLKNFLSKLRGTTARIALVVQLLYDPASNYITLISIKSAISLSAYFESQARVVYSNLQETSLDRERKKAMDWINSKKEGGKVTLRRMRRFGPNEFRGRVDGVLKDLQESGFGTLKGNTFTSCDIATK